MSWVISPLYKDPSFSNVSLLLHLEGANGSTSYTDSSSNSANNSILGESTISLTTSTAAFGGSSLSLGNGWLTISSSSSFQFGTSDFTVEFWARSTTVSGSNSELGLFHFYNLATGAGSSNGLGYQFYNTSGSRIVPGFTEFPGIYTANTWHHIALTRVSGTLRLFVNGRLSTGSAAFSGAANYDTLAIGWYRDSGKKFIGQVDEFRVTKTVARYTADFPIQPAPFPDI